MLFKTYIYSIFANPNFRSGVTTLTVTSTGRALHSYMIRDGFWSLCEGIIQYPNVPTSNSYTDMYSVPRCIGQEVRRLRVA